MTNPEEYFEALFDANYGDVLAYAVRRCRSRQDAEDVVAETFAVAWRRIADIPAAEHARPWLFGTARMVHLNQERARQRQRSVAERARDVLHIQPDHRIDAEPAEAERVREALPALTTIEREVLQLHVWEELSADEIAVVLDISTPAVWKRLQRARERLSRALEPAADADPATFGAAVQPVREEAP